MKLKVPIWELPYESTFSVLTDRGSRAGNVRTVPFVDNNVGNSWAAGQLQYQPTSRQNISRSCLQKVVPDHTGNLSKTKSVA